MSEEKQTEKGAAAPPPAPAPKSSPGPIGLLLPAILAGAAAFGGARFAAAHPPAAAAAPAERVAAPPPGPTIALEPFLVVNQDGNKKAHAMKVTLAVEFEAAEKEEALKGLTPRIRDAALSYLRTVSYEESVDAGKTDKLRTDLLERFRAAGVLGAQRVLVTDLVVQ